jgi:hypothetical protein
MGDHAAASVDAATMIGVASVVSKNLRFWHLRSPVIMLA